jgi:hypothetical protein
MPSPKRQGTVEKSRMTGNTLTERFWFLVPDTLLSAFQGLLMTGFTFLYHS